MLGVQWMDEDGLWRRLIDVDRRLGHFGVTIEGVSLTVKLCGGCHVAYSEHSFGKEKFTEGPNTQCVTCTQENFGPKPPKGKRT